MNYLGHAYFSFHHPQILLGNLISDFVKGKAKDFYPEGIRKGIELHRALDAFTDQHPATREAKAFFRPHYRLYSGALIDVLYDHFLALHPHFFNEMPLPLFSQQVYSTVEAHVAFLPPRFLQLFSYMKAEDWLLNYQHYSGVEKSLQGLVRRSAYLKESDTAYGLFREHYTELQALALNFLADVKEFAKQRFDTLV